MNTVEFSNGHTINVPSSFSEMTSRQICYLMQKYHLLEQGKIEYDQFLTYVLLHFLGYRRTAHSYIFERLDKQRAALRNEQTVLLCEQLLGFLFTREAHGLRLNFDTVVNPLPAIQVGRATLIGPADLLTDITFAQFRLATESMSLYFEHKDPAELLRMIAILYRAKNTKFDPENISCDLVCRLQPWQRTTILLWMIACITHIQHKEFCIGTKSVNLSPIFRGGSSDESLGWVSVLFSLAEKRIFGNMQQSDQAPLFDVLLFLYDNHLTIKEYERKQRN